MKTMRIAGAVGCVVLTAGLVARGQATSKGSESESKSQKAPETSVVEAGGTVESIDAEFQREVLALERRRLEHLARLAGNQQGEAAAATYELCLRRAIDAGLFTEAEPIAERVIQSGATDPVVVWLAHAVNILAEAGHGDYQKSLESLITAVQTGPEKSPEKLLPLGARVKLLEAYYQRLVQAGQYDIARRAFTLIRDDADEPVLRDYAANRLTQLELLGKPAPAIQGSSVDGKPVSLTDLHGNAVLVVFWASWCLPNAEQADRLDALDDAYGKRGFRILGVNVDALGDGVKDVDEVLPDVREFLIGHNVTWPNVLDTPDDGTIAGSYGVTEIPSSVLIGRDGTVIGLDLTGAALEAAVSAAVGPADPQAR